MTPGEAYGIISRAMPDDLRYGADIDEAFSEAFSVIYDVVLADIERRENEL